MNYHADKHAQNMQNNQAHGSDDMIRFVQHIPYSWTFSSLLDVQFNRLVLTVSTLVGSSACPPEPISPHSREVIVFVVVERRTFFSRSSQKPMHSKTDSK